MGSVTLTGDQFILVIILVKLGVMASLTSVLVRSRRFVDVLLTPRRSFATQAGLALSLGLPFAIGVGLRVVLGYEALDLAFSGAYVAGLVGGVNPGMMVGAMVGLPALAAGEWLAIPAGVTVGCVAGLVGGGRLVGEELWEISAVPLLDLARFLKSGLLAHQFDRRVLVVLSCLGLALAYDWVAGVVAREWLYRLASTSVPVTVAIWAGKLALVGIAVKVFNAARLQVKLESQAALLAQARYEALRSQIKPHFLFNTLTTISSSIRTNSEAAREMIVKLAAILRRALEPAEGFVPLRDELDFIDAYLDIETARFGPHRLEVQKDVDASVLETRVPSMILQPLVENAILHGIEPALRRGVIRIVARRQPGAVVVTIEDNGRGMDALRAARAQNHGIGVRNVRERLRVAYGDPFGLTFESVPGEGTRVSVMVPTNGQTQYGS